jgi:hypothetical protein
MENGEVDEINLSHHCECDIKTEEIDRSVEVEPLRHSRQMSYHH